LRGIAYRHVCLFGLVMDVSLLLCQLAWPKFLLDQSNFLLFWCEFRKTA